MRGWVYIAISICALLFAAEAAAFGDSVAVRRGPAVAVLPFDVLGDASRGWVGKALQEGLSGNIQQSGMQTTDKTAGADFVVSGSVQVVGDQMRIWGKSLTARGIRSSGVSARTGRFAICSISRTH